MITETDLDLPDGRSLHVYDSGTGTLPVFWQHGTPNTGEPPAPLFAAAADLDVRWVGYDRPGYHTSTPRPGRDVAAAATDIAAIADALGIDWFTVFGHSGGGPHALACAALLGDRVRAVAAVSGTAPRSSMTGWFDGMADPTELRAAERGADALREQLARGEFDPTVFTAADHAALGGDWRWLGEIAMAALPAGLTGMVDDDLAFVADWGFDPRDIDTTATPALVVHGREDRMVPCTHGQWLAERIGAPLWLRPGDGHVSVLSAGPEILSWLAEQSRGSAAQ